LALSRNQLQNRASKYARNDDSSPDNLLLDYTSSEIENKLRFENISRVGRHKITAGLSLEDATYTTNTFNKIPYVGDVRYSSDIYLVKYGVFAQWSSFLISEDLLLSAGLRLDGNTFSSGIRNPLDQVSPRFALSYRISERFRFNANTGRYYQLPACTILGHRDNSGRLDNQNGARYIRSDHVVAGLEYTTPTFLRVTLEGFYKEYGNYPFNLIDSISIANQGSDFGTVGNRPVRFNNQGRYYGVEFMMQQKLNKDLFGILAYTFLRSEFAGLDGNFIPSSWDYRHVVSLTGGKYFRKNWQAGFRFRFNSGTPYTPYDLQASLQRSNFDIAGQGIPDHRAVNSLRTEAFHQLDMRIDKKYYFRKWSLNVFLDVRNVYNNVTEFAPYISVQRDATGNPVVDPDNPDAYLPRFIPNEAGTLIPSIGIVVEF
jgi:hypothetical protein